MKLETPHLILVAVWFVVLITMQIVVGGNIVANGVAAFLITLVIGLPIVFIARIIVSTVQDSSAD